MMDIRKLLLENWGIKLISLALAISLWFFVTSKGKMEISLTVPIELQNIPAGMAVVGDVVRYLEVRVQAQERLLRDITAGKKVVCLLDLGMTRTGENALRISPDDIRRPSGVTVTHLSPYEIRVKLEPLLRKTVRLAPVLHGNPAPGYRIDEIAASPPRVTAEGPAGVIRPLVLLRTMPIDVQGAKSNVNLEPRIDTEGKPIKLLDKSVSIQIKIKKAAK
jgi:YbbR domain-containing protein